MEKPTIAQTALLDDITATTHVRILGLRLLQLKFTRLSHLNEGAFFFFLLLRLTHALCDLVCNDQNVSISYLFYEIRKF